jgi:hypothetical protein
MEIPGSNRATREALRIALFRVAHEGIHLAERRATGVSRSMARSTSSLIANALQAGAVEGLDRIDSSSVFEDFS